MTYLAFNGIFDGIDLSITRKIEKAGNIENTFKAAEDFLITNKQRWSDYPLGASEKRIV